MFINKFFCLIFITLVLQACGQTGSLYHPDEKAPIYVPEDQYPDSQEDK